MTIKIFTLFLTLLTTVLIVAAKASTADPENGRRLFNDPQLGNGTTGKSCQTCHAEGVGISKELSAKTTFVVMGIEQENLSETINFCIEVTLRGEGLEPDSLQMRDLTAYLIKLSQEGRRAGSRWVE